MQRGWRRRAVARGVMALLAGSLGLVSPAARGGEAEELRALKDEIAAERAALAKERAALSAQRKRVDDAIARLEDVEASQARTAATTAAPDGIPAIGAGPGEYQGPRLEIYGFAQLDSIYDFDRVDPSWNATLRPSKIPVNCPADAGCGADGETIFSVRQSRLGFKGFIPTRLGEMKTIFEFDLFGVGADEGQTTFRLRHAWGQLGQFGAGQTWSLFMDPDVFPNTIDYWGPAGMVFLRNPQVRWMPQVVDDERWSFALALESPGSGFDEGKAGLVDPSLELRSWNSYPDLTGQVRFSDEWGHAQLAAIMRGLGVEGRTGDGREVRFRQFGWGLNLSGVLEMGRLIPVLDGDQLLVQTAYGYGIANYMNDGGSDVGPDRDPPGARAETIPTLGWLIYYNRSWNERWTSSVGYSEHRQWNVTGQADDAFKTGQYFSVNALYHPLPDMLVGPELLWGRREDKNGDSGSDTRVQVSFKYNFSGTIYGNAR
jgi:hypothetical protein